jgi:hypothetical protein
VSGDESEDGVSYAAELRRELGISEGMQPEQASWFVDKLAMKERLLAVFPDTKTAPFVGLTKWPFTPEVIGKLYGLGFPLVIKPCDKCGGEGVSVIETPQQLETKLKSIIKLIGKSRFIAEKYIFGKTKRIDVLVVGGEVKSLFASDYDPTCLDFYIGGVVQTSYSDFSSKNHHRYLEIANKIVQAFKVEHGILHAEVIEDDDGEFYFLEVAARPGGDSEHLELYGFDVRKAYFESQFGLAPHYKDIKQPGEDDSFARIDFPVPPRNADEGLCLTNIEVPDLSHVLTAVDTFNREFAPTAQVLPRGSDSVGSLLFRGPKNKVRRDAARVLKKVRGHFEKISAKEQRNYNWPVRN